MQVREENPILYSHKTQLCFVTVQNRIFFTYLYLDNTTGMTHLKSTICCKCTTVSSWRWALEARNM